MKLFLGQPVRRTSQTGALVIGLQPSQAVFFSWQQNPSVDVCRALECLAHNPLSQTDQSKKNLDQRGPRSGARESR